MPRSGWLATGATVAALSAGVLGGRVPVAALLVVGGLALVGTLWLPTQVRRITLPLAVGGLAIAVRLAIGPAAPPLAGVPDGTGPWTMVVESMGSPRGGHQVATLRTVAAGDGGFRLAATLPRYPAIEPGDTIEIEGRARPRPDSPYGQYLERIGAWGSLDARMLRLASVPDLGPARALERLRRAAADALTVTLPEPEAGLAAGILIGLRDRVDRDVAAAFTTAGVSHVVAISGWNIAIVAAAISAVAGRLGRRRRAIVTVVAIAAYIAFAGASPSVLRAGAMAGVVLLARETGRAGYAAAALGWAVVVLLVAGPNLIADAGFQLSTVATAGLIAWATPLSERLAHLGGGRLPRWLVESLGVSIAAQVATLPIVLASFGRLAVIAPAVNLLVVPLVAPAMAAGVVALIAGVAVGLGVPTAVGAFLAAPSWVSLRLIVTIVEATAALPAASVTLEPPWGPVAGAGMAVAMGLVMIGQRRRRGRPAQAEPGQVTRLAVRAAPHRIRPGSPTSRITRAATVALIASIAITGGVIAARPPGVARVMVLDVGQGDAILVEGADGGRLLVDGGPDPDRLLVVLDRHIPPWDRRIDAVILTHPHEDHVAGLALLLDRYRVARVFEPGMRGPGPGYAAWLDRLDRPDAPVRRGLATGDRLRVDDVRLRVLWPDRGSVPTEPPDTGTGINNVSIVLLGEVGGRRFLLAGDIEQDIDPVVLARGIPRVDVLKVSHHGSRTATTEAFVAATRPSVAIASAGADNPYGHPARSTLDRLRASGARVYRTDRDGTITIGFDAEAITVRSEPRVAAERGGVGAVGAVGAAAVSLRSGRSFACAIASPGRAVEPSERPLPATGALAAAAPTPPSGAIDRLDQRLGYHRTDDGPLTGGGRGPAPLPGSPGLGPRARARRGRGRGLAGAPDRGARHARGPARRRGRGAAPRRRQVAPAGRPGARPPPRPGIGGVADAARPRRTRPAGRGPSRHAAGGRGGASALGGVRRSRGTDRGLCGQAGRPAPGVDGSSVHLLGPPLPGNLGGRHPAHGSGPGGPSGGGRVPGGRGGAGGGRPAALDGGGPPRSACRGTSRGACTSGRTSRGADTSGRTSRVIAPLLYIWGDDDLVAGRLIDRFERGLGEALDTPLERWELRASLVTAAADAARLEERLATAVLFGGGTLAIVSSPGALVRRNDTRDRVVAVIGRMGAGNAVAFVEATKSNAKGPGPRRLADAVTAAGGRIVSAMAPRPVSLGAWIDAEARDRGLDLAPGAARELADRLGARVTDGDVDRRYLSRVASGELDKLALRHAIDGGPVTIEDVRALVAESTPGSVWALTDAVSERRGPAALAALERLLETTPEPVLLAVLHRRVVELLELGDRMAGGADLPAAARSMGITSEFRAKTLGVQARRWTTDELAAALADLVELDAMVKGAPGSEADAAQRRLAFTMWVRDHVTGGSGAPYT